MIIQRKQIILSDNAFKSLNELGLNLSDKEKKLLNKYSQKTLPELCKENPDLLVFPKNIDEYREKWNKRSCLFRLHEENDCKIEAYSFIGFFGIGSLHFQIHSRFDANMSKSYFLQYMLRRIFRVYMLHLPTNSDPEPIWDFLFYLFPNYLKRALRQGIFRTYRTFERNDYHVRGTIDFSRQLRVNTPFCGRIAYRTREYSGNNPVTHLIRHTIEALRTNPRAACLLTADNEIRAAVRTIVELTPDYNRCNLSKVMAGNLHPLCHPYYTEYGGLQNLCLKILRHERITYGQSEDRINGIVFKADNLWEQYLAEVFDEANCGIHRGENNSIDPSKTIPIYQKKTKSEVPLAPDFFSSNLVMDAKYKDIIDDDNPSKVALKREDRNQIITYLHLHHASAGFLIYPSNKVKKTKLLYEFEGNGVLNGLGGTIGVIPFAIPQNCSSFVDFQEGIRESEKDLIAIVKAHL